VAGFVRPRRASARGDRLVGMAHMDHSARYRPIPASFAVAYEKIRLGFAPKFGTIALRLDHAELLGNSMKVEGKPPFDPELFLARVGTGKPVLDALTGACWASAKRIVSRMKSTFVGMPILLSSTDLIGLLEAKLNSVDPQAWLADVLCRIADHPASRLYELLPWHWKQRGRSTSSMTR
jgi:hypothetical protein